MAAPILRDIDLVIFDCDGVLVDSEHLAAEAMMGVLCGAGVPVEIAHILPGIGMKQADIIAVIEAQIGRTIDPGLLGSLWPETRRIFAERLQPTPGVDAFLDALPTARCVASSSHRERILFSLETTGLMRHFAADAIFSSTEVANGKPAPDLVLHAASRMGVDPDRCLVIEDSRFGVMGAVAAGMVAAGYTGGCHATPQSAGLLDASGAAFTVSGWKALGEALAPYRLRSAGDRMDTPAKED